MKEARLPLLLSSCLTGAIPWITYTVPMESALHPSRRDGYHPSTFTSTSGSSTTSSPCPTQGVLVASASIRALWAQTAAPAEDESDWLEGVSSHLRGKSEDISHHSCHELWGYPRDSPHKLGHPFPTRHLVLSQ
ncbi:hypothetical protein JZ751_015287 [Albula glossodonta]|uniref:Uncharacterized protein n=1 Tax=Albula glossodonta TaxID=121402 RepID=A0A8T2NS85_9TELE|nr:hypothetical protein JZ751_015287 [Albula glossodonta]